LKKFKLLKILQKIKKKFKNEFQKKLKDQIQYINNNMNVSNLMYVTNIINVKFEIYNFFYNKLKEYFNKENNIIFEIINDIQNRQYIIQKDLINFIFYSIKFIELKLNFLNFLIKLIIFYFFYFKLFYLYFRNLLFVLKLYFFNPCYILLVLLLFCLNLYFLF